MKVTARLILTAALVVASACVPTPEDTLSYGTLCAPATDECPSVATLQRDAIGRNQVDYVVQTERTAPATAEVLALVPGVDLNAADIAPEDLIVRRTHDALTSDNPGEGRFTPIDLGARDTFQFGVRCASCDVVVEFVHSSVPRECYEDQDCPASWQCDVASARCVECMSDLDCSTEQRCNIDTGRCNPPNISRGCGTAGRQMGGSLLFVLVLALACRTAARRRRTVATSAVLFAVMLAPQLADAAPPRASISVAGGARVLTGELAPLTKRGVGLSIQQELRWRYIGAAMALSTSYFLTRQEPPPFSRSLQTYGVAIGPRGYLPLSPFELVIGADYRRLGTASNSLIRVTGPRRSFDAVGGMGGARVRWSGLEVRLDVHAHHLVQLNTTLIGVDLGIGFTNTQ